MRRSLTALALALMIVAAASDTVSAAVIRKSTFATTNEGWQWIAFGGTPVVAVWDDGRVRASPNDPVFFQFLWLPPEKFEGRWIKAYKGKLTFAMEWDGVNSTPRASNVTVHIAGADVPLGMHYTFPDRVFVTGEPQQTWNAPLRPAGWVDADDDPITATYMKAVLSNVGSWSIEISSNVRADDDLWLDGVKVKTPN